MSDEHQLFGFAKKDIQKDYEILQQLGVGKFSVVKLAISKKGGNSSVEPNTRVAIKQINKEGCPAALLTKEIQVMDYIGKHPGVISLLDLYEDKENVYMVLELVTGGELFDMIVATDVYSEKTASNFIRQVVETVAMLHEKRIVHRDLKPENLLLEDASAKRIKVCDFGLADIMTSDDDEFDMVVGSPNYMAPEVLAGTGYGKAVDLYSIGVILYTLLCGYLPLEPEAGITVLEFPSPDWDSISDQVKELIELLLDKVPSKRPTAKQMLQHPWVQGEKVSEKVLVGTIRNLGKFTTKSKAQRVVKGNVFNLFGLNDASGGTGTGTGTAPVIKSTITPAPVPSSIVKNSKVTAPGAAGAIITHVVNKPPSSTTTTSQSPSSNSLAGSSSTKNTSSSSSSSKPSSSSSSRDREKDKDGSRDRSSSSRDKDKSRSSHSSSRDRDHHHSSSSSRDRDHHHHSSSRDREKDKDRRDRSGSHHHSSSSSRDKHRDGSSSSSRNGSSGTSSKERSSHSSSSKHRDGSGGGGGLGSAWKSSAADDSGLGGVSGEVKTRPRSHTTGSASPSKEGSNTEHAPRSRSPRSRSPGSNSSKDSDKKESNGKSSSSSSKKEPISSKSDRDIAKLGDGLKKSTLDDLKTSSGKSERRSSSSRPNNSSPSPSRDPSKEKKRGSAPRPSSSSSKSKSTKESGSGGTSGVKITE